ncbi:MAG: hypothetical protein Ta2B_30260 [Termitinemataceae bacterium]|nr:MAG: hypothetical protein Ta2B_30260 [Termitinemataceae bacterium]
MNKDSLKQNYLQCSKNVKNIIQIFDHLHGRWAFLAKAHRNEKILGVGCGNVLPYKIKTLFPNIIYTGIDICNYPEDSGIKFADNFIVCSPVEFHNEIKRKEKYYDKILSCHNLEHCDNRDETLIAMAKALKTNGLLYISFPSETTINLPSRRGTLNYYDDKSHKQIPPEYKTVINILKNNGMEILFSRKNYKPFLPFLIGFLLEGISKRKNKVLFGTWDYYGFETVIWAKKK